MPSYILCHGSKFFKTCPSQNLSILKLLLLLFLTLPSSKYKGCEVKLLCWLIIFFHFSSFYALSNLSIFFFLRSAFVLRFSLSPHFQRKSTKISLRFLFVPDDVNFYTFILFYKNINVVLMLLLLYRTLFAFKNILYTHLQ